jgi:hypothetical protein
MIMDTNRSILRVGLVGLVSIVVVGCVADGSGSPTIEDVVASKTVESGVPEGARAISGGVYAVPVAVDEDGCEQFSQWSATGVTQQVIVYHDGKGGFTATKSDDYSCNAEMVQTGEDIRGCAIYQAEQPDGSATEVVYYRSAGGFTANPDRAVCEG